MFNKDMLIYEGRKKRKEKPKEERRHGPVNIRVMVYCFIATFILYMMLLAIERSLLKSDEKVQVYVAVSDIPASLMITEDNFDDYFNSAQRSLDALPDGAITNAAELVGTLTTRSISRNEIALTSAFVREENMTADIKNPVEVSMNATNLSQVVGGVIRTGDFINIWSVKSESADGSDKQAVLIYEGAYVTRAFTTQGTEVSRDGKEEAATTIINIIIPAEFEEDFNRAISEGSIRLSRIVNYEVKTDAAD